MEQREDPDELLEIVARRDDVLWELDGAALSKPDLEDRLRVSRSTIDRAVRELETAELVKRVGGEFTATTAGQLAIREYRSLTDRLDTIDEATRFLTYLPFSDAPPPDVLMDAEFRWPEPPEPSRALEPLVEILHRANTLRAFSRAVSDPKVLGDLEQQVVEGNLDVEFVYSKAMVDHLRSRYADRMDTIRSQENFRIAMAETLPFSLGITHGSEMDPQLIVIVYNEQGELRGVLYNDTPAAIAWGEDIFRRYRREATEL